MRTFTFKGLFLTAVFMLLGCSSLYAADDDLITRQITIKLDKAGTLPDKIGSSRMYKITNLKLVGEINGTDWKMIREMAGINYNGYSTEGKLSTLDLSEAKIVKGGYAYSTRYYTSNDEIGDYAFYNCRRLTSLNLPSSITSIGESAFENCSGLTSLNLPDGITEIDKYAFYGCSGLTSLTLPASITTIGDYAFYGCSGLTSLTIPDGVTKIGVCTFSNCSYLTSLTIPSSVNFLGGYAFQECTNLQSVYVSWQNPISAGSAFYGVNIKNCTLYVPQGTEQDYFLADVWGDFGNIVEFDATGIDKPTTSTDVEEVSRYSVNGQRLVCPTKGLNIVKYSDGSVKKVVVQ